MVILICLLNTFGDFLSIAGQMADHEKGKYTLIRDGEDSQLGIYDKPLPCFGCGIGWFSYVY